MNCNKCGASLAEGTKFCPSCGSDLTTVQNEQVVAEQPTVNNVEQPATPEVVAQPVGNTTQTAAKEDKVNIGLAILSWFIPLAGLIIFIVQKNKSPKTAKVSGICALISFLLNLVVVGLAFILLIGTFSFVSNEIDNTANEIINEAKNEVENQIENELENDSEDYTNSDVAVSSNWKNYQLAINGKTYKLPMTYDELSSATGFTMKKEDLESELNTKFYTMVNLYKDDKLALYTEVTNNSGEKVKYTEAKITRITQSKYQVATNNAEKIIFPGGLTVGEAITESELKALFGEPNETKTYSTRTYYTYYEDETWTTTDNFKITVVDGIIDEIQLDNRSSVF